MDEAGTVKDFVLQDLEEAKASADCLMGNRDGLLELNKYVLQLIRETDRQAGQKALSQFRVGDHVWWTSRKRGGNMVTGRIVRINPKTVGIDGDDGVQWRVHWSYLNKT